MITEREEQLQRLLRWKFDLRELCISALTLALTLYTFSVENVLPKLRGDLSLALYIANFRKNVESPTKHTHTDYSSPLLSSIIDTLQPKMLRTDQTE